MILDEKIAFLTRFFQQNAQIVIAFSGGVDSSVLAAAAVRFAPNKTAGFLAVSPTSTAESVQYAKQAADEIGLKLTILETSEFTDSNFLRNDRRRCYYCKKVRFSAIQQAAFQQFGPQVRPIFTEGSNADDLSDYRPGRDAAAELHFTAPLADAALTKADIRYLAAKWSLSSANRPSEPCLATRLAFGIPLDSGLLRKIEQGEKILHRAGFPVCRLRLDSPGQARIEVPPEQVPRLQQLSEIPGKIASIGFSAVAIDPEGYVSGKMNQILQKNENDP